MNIFILGVGDAFSVKHYNTCFIVQSETGFNIGIECPHPYLKILSEIKIKNEDIPTIDMIDNFVITHLHADHCSGLETIGFYKKFIEKKTVGINMAWSDLEKFCPMIEPGMGSTIANGKLIKSFPFTFFNPLMNEIGPFTIESHPTLHYTPSRALIIREGDKAIGFSGDTAFNHELIEWLAQADLILHEVGPAPGHTPLEELAKLPQNIRDKIILIHYSDYLKTNIFETAKEGTSIYIG